MPSPFPGMDPYIEMYEWSDFHPRLMTYISDQISDQLPAGYVARVERRTYMELEWDLDVFDTPPAHDQLMIPDVTVVEDWRDSGGGTATAVAEAVAPVHCTLAQPVERRETYLEIREVPSRRIITAIEVLSPSNKRAGSQGAALYAEKRRSVLESETHFIEIDLLRGGQRVLNVKGDPGGDYYILVSPAPLRPKVDVYAWTIRHKIPPVKLPLKPGDPEVLLNLQAILNVAYDRLRYGSTLDYSQPLRSPLAPNDAEGLKQRIAALRPA